MSGHLGMVDRGRVVGRLVVGRGGLMVGRGGLMVRRGGCVVGSGLVVGGSRGVVPRIWYYHTFTTTFN